MDRKRAILNEVLTTRDEARLHLHAFSLQARERFFDLEAALEAIEHRLVGGTEKVSDAMLEKARDLAGSMRALLTRDAA